MVKPREDSLQQRVVHLVMDLRLNIVNQRLNELKLALRTVANDHQQMMKLLMEMKDTQELRDMLAQKLGSDVMK